jgi:hypothetical protein
LEGALFLAQNKFPFLPHPTALAVQALSPSRLAGQVPPRGEGDFFRVPLYFLKITVPFY